MPLIRYDPDAHVRAQLSVNLEIKGLQKVVSKRLRWAIRGFKLIGWLGGFTITLRNGERK
jgi:hypothetical protein